MSTAPGNSKPKRRWFQFSLRSLLVFMAVVPLPFWWLSNERQAIRKQKEAIRRIQDSQSSVTYEDKSQPSGWRRFLLGDDADVDVIAVKLSGGVTDTQLADIAALRNLRRLEIRFFGDHYEPTPLVTDAGLASLQDLTKLQTLILESTQITDAGLAAISRHSDLRVVSLQGTRVTEEGLVQLAKLTKLERLDLRSTQVTDAGLLRLARLTSLESLELGNTSVGDAGLAHLAELKHLTSLDLNHTRVTDAGLVHLASLTNVEDLRLHGTHVTDAGMVHLARVASLKTLTIYRTGVTANGEERLKRALPQLNILPEPAP